MDTYSGNSFDPLTLHKYLYCNADPVNNYDPSGNCTLMDEEAAMAIRNTLGEIQSNYYNYILNTLMEMMNGKSPDEALKSATYQQIFFAALPLGINSMVKFGSKFLRFAKELRFLEYS